jgi:hypothetical protein
MDVFPKSGDLSFHAFKGPSADQGRPPNVLYWFFGNGENAQGNIWDLRLHQVAKRCVDTGTQGRRDFD